MPVRALIAGWWPLFGHLLHAPAPAMRAMSFRELRLGIVWIEQYLDARKGAGHEEG